MSRRKKIGLWAAGGLAALALVLSLVLPSWGMGSRPLPLHTEAVERGPLAAKVTATGTLSSLVSVQVGSQVSGTLREILVDFNSPVTKGQVLARIDPRLFESALEQARANQKAAEGNLAKAKAQAADAERQYQRSRDLAAKNLVPQADLDTAQSAAQAAEAQITASEGSLAQAQASLLQAEVNLEYATILSPINGIVISRNVDMGQTVAASLQAPTLFTIAEDLRKMQVDTSVAEADVGKLEPGMTATFSVDAYPGQTFQGKVRQVRNAPQVVQNVVTYDAVIDVQNEELRLKPGMTANVTFVYAERDDALKIPNAALRFHAPPEWTEKEGSGKPPAGRLASAQTVARPAGESAARNRKTIWVVRDENPRPVAVVTGISDGIFTEAAGGDLRPGDLVVTEAGSTQAADKRAPSRSMSGSMKRLF
jgi:HlyD family secretion protein